MKPHAHPPRDPAVVVRFGAPADLSEVLRMDEALIRYDLRFDPTLDPGWSRTEEGLAYFQSRLTRDKGSMLLLAEMDGRPVGYLSAAAAEAESYRTTGRLAEVECLFVEPSARGRGIGEQLLTAFRDWAHAQGLDRMRVVVSSANEGALRFYARHGFGPYDTVLEGSTNPDPGTRRSLQR